MIKFHFMLIIVLFLIPVNALAEQSLYGIYSNMNSVSGEPSGLEMFFLHDGRPGRCSDSVLFQVSEGWPQYPELLDCCNCSVNQIQFVKFINFEYDHFPADPFSFSDGFYDTFYVSYQHLSDSLILEWNPVSQSTDSLIDFREYPVNVSTDSLVVMDTLVYGKDRKFVEFSNLLIEEKYLSGIGRVLYKRNADMITRRLISCKVDGIEYLDSW